jgi:hypothetical protein
MKIITDQVLYIISKLRKKAFTRLKPYISQILKKGYANSEKEMKKVFNN